MIVDNKKKNIYVRLKHLHRHEQNKTKIKPN